MNKNIAKNFLSIDASIFVVKYDPKNAPIEPNIAIGRANFHFIFLFFIFIILANIEAPYKKY